MRDEDRNLLPVTLGTIRRIVAETRRAIQPQPVAATVPDFYVITKDGDRIPASIAPKRSGGR